MGPTSRGSGGHEGEKVDRVLLGCREIGETNKVAIFVLVRCVFLEAIGSGCCVERMIMRMVLQKEELNESRRAVVVQQEYSRT